MLSRFHLIPERNGQADGQTDRFAISIPRVSMLPRDKKRTQRPIRIYSASPKNRTATINST